MNDCYIAGACQGGEDWLLQAFAFLSQNGKSTVATDDTPDVPMKGMSEKPLLIAADGGYRFLHDHGLRPDWVVGDFDSLGFEPQNERLIRHPVRKDDTDTMLAVKIGLENGCRRFFITGGMGGRLDHTLANLQTLAFIAEHGGVGYLLGAKENAVVFRSGELRFPAEAKGVISVFALCGPAKGVDLRGFSFPLENAELTGSFPLGTSNEFIGQSAYVRVREGALTILWRQTDILPVWYPLS